MKKYVSLIIVFTILIFVLHIQLIGLSQVPILNIHDLTNPNFWIQNSTNKATYNSGILYLPSGEEIGGTINRFLGANTSIQDYKASFNMKLNKKVGTNLGSTSRFYVTLKSKELNTTNFMSTSTKNGYWLDFSEASFNFMMGTKILQYCSSQDVIFADGNYHSYSISMYDNDIGGVVIKVVVDKKMLLSYSNDSVDPILTYNGLDTGYTDRLRGLGNMQINTTSLSVSLKPTVFEEEILRDGIINGDEISYFISNSPSDKVKIWNNELVSFTIAQNALNQIISTGKPIEINFADGTMFIPNNVFSAISQPYRDVTFTFKAMESANINNFNNVINNNQITPVNNLYYEISISRDGYPVSLSLPIIITINKTISIQGESFYFVCMEKDESISTVLASYAEGKITFEATNFNFYTMTYNKIDTIKLGSLNYGMTLKISNENFISNIQPQTTLAQIKKQLIPIGTDLFITDIFDNFLEEDNSIIGTGTNIEVNNGGDITIYSVVIYGDVNGDSLIDLNDLVSIKDHLLEVSQISGTFKRAGDLYKENNITLNDLVGMMSYISESGGINQNQ